MVNAGVGEAVSEIMASTVNAAARDRPGVQDDDFYGADGLLYCGKCGTKKQTRIQFNGAEYTVGCMCRCESEAKEKKEEQIRYDEAMRHIGRLRNASLLDDRLKKVNFSTFQKNRDNSKLYNLAVRYVERFDEMFEKRQGILFYGEVGTGKSYIAACIANELMNRHVPVVMTSFVKILQAVQSPETEETELLNQLDSAKLLIIDDLGTERNTDYVLEKVYNVIDTRYRAGKPLILTSNLALQEMQDCQDIRYRRIYDRVLEMCYPVMVRGKSWRIERAADNFDAMRMLLEG